MGRGSAEDHQYRSLLENSSDVVWTIDVTGKLTYISPSVQQLIGYTQAEALRRDWFDFLTPESRAVIADDIERVVSLAANGERASPLEIELEFLRKDGSSVWAEAIRQGIYDDFGGLVGIQGTTRDITERRRITEKLRENEHFLQTLIDAIPNPVFYKNAEAIYQGCNQAFEAYLGKAKDGIVGASVYDVAPKHLADIYHEMDMKLINQGGTQIYESQVRYADGSTHDVIFNKARFFDNKGTVGGLVGVILDITDRKLAESGLLKEKTQIQKLLDFYQRAYSRVEDLMSFVVEECLKISESPLGFLGFINEDETEMRTHIWSEEADAQRDMDNKPMLFPLSNAGFWAEALRTRIPLIVNDYHQADSRKKGFPVYLLPVNRLMCIPVIENGKAVAIFAVANKAREYTDGDLIHLRLFIENMWGVLKRREAEEKLRQLNADLEQLVQTRSLQLLETQEELMRKEKLAVLGQLSGSISHELRNPLTVIGSAVSLLKSTLPDTAAEALEYLGIIEHEIDKSQSIISDLLDFARIRPVDKVAVSVAELIGEVLSGCDVPENVSVVRQITDDLPPLRVDRRQLEQVFRNLIVNGFQAMVDGGTLTIQALVRNTDKFTIKIIDDGPGISPENLRKIFHPLYTTKAKGIGLGLVICKNLVENNGGTIEVASEVGRGATFSLSFPLDPN